MCGEEDAILASKSTQYKVTFQLEHKTRSNSRTYYFCIVYWDIIITVI